MAYTVPAEFPDSIRAGDTLEFKIIDSTFPASDWILKIVFVRSGEQIAITSTADGDYHLFSESSTITKDYVSGIYQYHGYFENIADTTKKITWRNGTIEVTPDFASATGGYDASTLYESIISAMETYFRSEQTLQDYTLMKRKTGDLDVEFGDLPKLIEFYEKMKNKLNTSLTQNRAKEGKPNPNVIGTRFR